MSPAFRVALHSRAAEAEIEEEIEGKIGDELLTILDRRSRDPGPSL